MCDSALSAKGDVNDISLDGETDDEDMEDGRWVGIIRVRPTDCPRTPRAHDHASTIQIMVQVLRDGTWCELVAQEIRCSRLEGVPHVSMDYGFLGER